MLSRSEAQEKMRDLRDMAKTLGVEEICEPLFMDVSFYQHSASGHSNQHHYGLHGLLEHTWEVVKSSEEMAKFHGKYKINRKVLFLAALFHDYGKTYDYIQCGENDWKKTEHARKVHHITRSVLLFQKSVDIHYQLCQEEQLKDIEITEAEAYEVTHCILSHHGRREWGSPVAPNTREAFILHYCDGISARLYDCETLDRLD